MLNRIAHLVTSFPWRVALVALAALLFCVAVGAFARSQIVVIKELGVGIAAGVMLGATDVRALLVPSLMALLGRWNWWAPQSLRRLHAVFGLEESQSLPADLGLAARGAL